MSEAIENKVAKSGLITLDLEEVKPDWNIMDFDLAQTLWEGLALKEKDFRAFVDSYDWESFRGAFVHVHCSGDAIIPTWAYMLVGSHLRSICNYSIVGTRTELEQLLWLQWVKDLDLSSFTDQRVVLKGCSDEAIPESVYLALASRLTSVVKSLMFGEPCSTVPVFKKK
ncbi:MAG: DUF2480 family protein [Cryomorphaceae bacterium]